MVYQTLVRHLNAAYFSNLTSLFPHSPLTALRLFGNRAQTPQSTPHSFYGRTSGLGGTNDALYLWDRWLGKDRNAPPRDLDSQQRLAMRQFFAAATEFFGRPVINKNNNLNISAHLVAETIDDAYFICLTRSAQELAESLYRARCDIHGDPSLPYGVAPPVAVSVGPASSGPASRTSSGPASSGPASSGSASSGSVSRGIRSVCDQ